MKPLRLTLIAVVVAAVLAFAGYVVLRPACGCTQNVDAGIGEPVHLSDHLEIVLTGDSRAEVPRTSLRTPRRDLLVTHFRIWNRGSVPLTVATHVRAHDQVAVRSPSTRGSTDPSIVGARVRPGQKKTGSIPFLVAHGSQVTVTYAWAGAVVHWTIP
jgi:hypothetical protein